MVKNVSASQDHLPSKKVKVAVLGLDRAGKTTLILRLKYNKFFDGTRPTIGMNVETFKIGEVTINCTDIGGQLQFRKSIWESFTKGAQGIVYVIDAADKRRYAEARTYLWYTIKMEHLKDKRIPVAILANKVDLIPDIRKEDMTNFLGISKHMAKEICVFLTSAKTGVGVKEAMLWLADKIQEHNQTYSLKLFRTLIS